MTPETLPYKISGENRGSNIVVTCDHASNRIPPEVGDLGVSSADMERHIAYDVGAAAVAVALGVLLDAPVICSNFSRLVIDPNRGEDDPTLIMQIYDGTIIQGNRHLSQKARDWRLTHCYRPYHAALQRLLKTRTSPVLIAIHSFTSQLQGQPPRPWHIGILHEKDQRLAQPLLTRLRREPDLCIGENQPYGGHLDGDTIDKHAISHNIPNALIEIRNDLIRSDGTQKAWAARLAPVLHDVINTTPL